MRFLAFYLLIVAVATWLLVWPYWAAFGTLSGFLSQ